MQALNNGQLSIFIDKAKKNMAFINRDIIPFHLLCALKECSRSAGSRLLPTALQNFYCSLCWQLLESCQLWDHAVGLIVLLLIFTTSYNFQNQMRGKSPKDNISPAGLLKSLSFCAEITLEENTTDFLGLKIMLTLEEKMKLSVPCPLQLLNASLA